MTGEARHQAAWRPQSRFVARIASKRQLRAFNDTGGIAVNFDVPRAVVPAIAIDGSQSESLSLWETRTETGFLTQPKFDAALVTIRFVTSGHIVYRNRGGDATGSPTHATLTGFEDLLEVQASPAFGAVSATVAVETLVAANGALTGGEHPGLPALAPCAEIATPAMRALYCTVLQMQRRIQDMDARDDLVFPLVREVMSYQLLSAWPRRAPVAPRPGGEAASRSLRRALDYIDTNLSTPLTLSDIAAAAGISVRALQDKFRKELGRTPVQHIIEHRLARAHRELTAPADDARTIAEIARRWGFTHMSDFGQRYRRLYGRTPSQARTEARRPH